MRRDGRWRETQIVRAFPRTSENMPSLSAGDPLANQVEAEGRGLVTRFDQLPLPAHVPINPSPARDGKGLCRRRTVQELRHDGSARQGEGHRAVLLGLGQVEEDTRA